MRCAGLLAPTSHGAVSASGDEGRLTDESRVVQLLDDEPAEVGAGDLVAQAELKVGAGANPSGGRAINQVWRADERPVKITGHDQSGFALAIAHGTASDQAEHATEDSRAERLVVAWHVDTSAADQRTRTS